MHAHAVLVSGGKVAGSGRGSGECVRVVWVGRWECASRVGIFFAEALRFKKRVISGIGCGCGEWISLVDVGEKGMSE